MVLRRDGRGVVAVGQAAHAWLCGQLARAWGNAQFDSVVPLAEVVLGAEQHDVGMAEWDLHPTLNPQTGLPQSFTEMELAANLGLWRAGPLRLSSQSRYAALLATMHGRRLYERRDLSAAPAAEAQLIEGFLAESRVQEAWLLQALRDDPATAAHATDERVARNSQLLWTWDTLSLALLLDWAPLTLRDVPATGADMTDVELSADGVLDPWPFAAPVVSVHCDARRLDGTFADDAGLAAGLSRAPWETVRFELQHS
jgi:hypothetical protein